MKKQTLLVIAILAALFYCPITFFTSCKKSSGGSSDSGTFYFHLHTQVNDSTIGGNPGPDSTNWAFDSNGRYIYLSTPQFFISGIQLVNANGNVYYVNAVLLKGLDSEDYYLAKVPVGTYVSANFVVGLNSTDNALSPATLFITDGNYFPLESSMYLGTGSGYNSMIIQGIYDSSSHPGSINASPGANDLFTFNYAIPNAMTSGITIKMPTRGSSSFPVYSLLSGGTQYCHLLCDYGRLMYSVNYITQNQTNGTSIAPAVADTLVAHLSNMFRYEQ